MNQNLENGIENCINGKTFFKNSVFMIHIKKFIECHCKLKIFFPTVQCLLKFIAVHLFSGEALAEAIQTTSLDDDAVFMLVELLNEKSNQGKWMTVSFSACHFKP